MSASVRNILFVMCDQLRADYLGCAGHPSLRTPNVDALARRGVRFDRAYAQAPVCGGSRMSFYTGRYAFTHGAHYNNFPLRVDELGIGDHLQALGARTVLVGKTHVKADVETLDRLGVAGAARAAVREGGFDAFERDDGLHPDQVLDPDQGYIRYLRARGYEADNPWHDFANSAAGPDGEVLSGWHMRNARLPARVREEDSETAYITDRAIEFLRGAGDGPWCLHVSYIKPHWPYIAPAPYHDRYDESHVLPANRSEAERDDPHPVVGAFMQHDESVCFADETCRRTVIPTYMGLIEQIDHHLGRLLGALESLGRSDDTLVVLTSDHGDYLGDHWLGEKDLFHEEVVRLPMIVCDPSPAADPTRGTASDALVESIDLAPTFVEALGGNAPPHRLEGRSLLPLLRGETGVAWRDAAFADGDWSLRKARRALGLGPDEARAFMVRTARWKYVEHLRFRPQLFDLDGDPRELVDLGADPGQEAVRREMRDRLTEWLMGRRTRTTLSDDDVEARTGKARERGYLFGIW